MTRKEHDFARRDYLVPALYGPHAATFFGRSRDLNFPVTEL